MVKLWRRIKLIIAGALLYVIALAFIIYVFSLLQNRIEFIVVSVTGLLYVHISLHGIALEDQIIGSIFVQLSSVGKLRVILSAWTEEEFSRMEEGLAEQLKDRIIIREIARLYLVLVEVFCVYQLLKHISEPFSSFVAPLIPHALMPFF